MKHIVMLFLLLLCATPAIARDPLGFSLHKLGSGEPENPTMLVIGGIQGDEPGGFNAAALLASHYTLHKGTVWVVPNLNFLSIIKRSRGVHGDMNRKFANLAPSDPEYPTVQKIKQIITHPQVDLVVNLHDGSGFYRPTWQDTQHNPHRWGQSVIIDQSSISVPYGNLKEMAGKAVEDANKGLVKAEDTYHLKNTHTRKGDKEMEKTLTYFAIRHGKPAFGVEASKNFLTNMRAYYHIRVLESFMRQMGIEFSRDFSLSPQGILAAINRDIAVAFHDDRVKLDLRDVRSSLNYVPLQRGAEYDFTASKPLLTVVRSGNGYRVYYGNRKLTKLRPQYFDYDESLSQLSCVVDGILKTVPFGQIVSVADSFTVIPQEGYRVNAIGFTRKGLRSECGVAIHRRDFLRRYSVDNSGSTFRIEVYKGKKFSGMVLVRYGENHNRQTASLHVP